MTCRDARQISLFLAVELGEGWQGGIGSSFFIVADETRLSQQHKIPYCSSGRGDAMTRTGTAPAPTKVMIVECDPLTRANTALLLGGEPGFLVCGAFGSGEECLAALDEKIPDILVIDINLSGFPGVEVIRQVKRRVPEVDIMSWTHSDDRETVFSCLKNGASGYILKGSTPRQFVEALHDMAEGGAPMSPKIARAVINELHTPGTEDPYLLTPRELEVLRLLEKGQSYKGISGICGISTHTVNSHIKKIYEKLHAKDRRSALVSARRRGII